MEIKIFTAAEFSTPIGTMLAIADEKALYLLEFVDTQKFEQKIERFKQKTQSTIVSGTTQPINTINTELDQYFNGTLKEFKTPVSFLGSSFQKSVWEQLQKIPFGQTQSYSNIACTLEKPTAFRAVALANAANQLAIIIPCHRVINSNGNLGGYGGGITRKKWFIEHEKRMSQ